MQFDSVIIFRYWVRIPSQPSILGYIAIVCSISQWARFPNTRQWVRIPPHNVYSQMVCSISIRTLSIQFFRYQDGRVVKALDLSSNGHMSAWVRTPLLVKVLKAIQNTVQPKQMIRMHRYCKTQSSGFSSYSQRYQRGQSSFLQLHKFRGEIFALASPKYGQRPHFRFQLLLHDNFKIQDKPV